MIKHVLKYTKEYGVSQGARISYSKFVELLLKGLGRLSNYGQSPFEEEWDILILLDACRYDLFEEFASNHTLYKRFESIDYRYSCASSSVEWIDKVYNKGPSDVLSDTHLVSANGWEPLKIDLAMFGGVSPVWLYESDSNPTIPPNIVTDAAIHAGRSTNCNRLIIHYMQPHAPFLHVAGKYNSVNEAPGQGRSQNVWEGLREGKYESKEIWKDYGENLITALDEVERLIKNISGNMIISADHANAMGEWGVYGHPDYVPHPAIKKVPWVRCEAKDKLTSAPDNPIEKMDKSRDLEEHLQDLGYKV